MRNETISVIIPVYNVAAYLPECLDSVLNQNYRDLEVILIDDGSKDDSGRICDDYAARDSRIQVIHQENGGGAAAKNAGLRIASGEYLSFVDSDDYLEPHVYRYMLDLLKTTDSDAAVFAYRNVFRSRTEEYCPMMEKRELTGKEYLVQFTKDWTCALLWNKLYKRSLFEGIFFEEGHKIDDEYFTYQGIMNARKVVCDDKIIYNYRRRGSSVMLQSQAHKQRTLDRVDAYAKRRKTVIARFPELRRAFDIQYLDALSYMTEYPDNTVESQNLMKTELRAYHHQWGNTIAPKCLWKGLLRLYLVPTKNLLRKYGRHQNPEDQKDFFP